MDANRWLDFELTSSPSIPGVAIRLGDFGSRWVAIVRRGAARTDGLGSSAREALLAALAPFGSRATTTMMADPAMFAASAAVLANDA